MFRVLKRRCVTQMDERRFTLEEGNVVSVTGGVTRALVNVGSYHPDRLA